MNQKDQTHQRTGTHFTKKTDPSSDGCSAYKGFKLVNKHEAAAILGVSPETLKKYRLQDGSTLVEGIHYHTWNSRTIRYNAELLADWGLNRNTPVQHQRTIESYLATLQPKRKRGFSFKTQDV